MYSENLRLNRKTNLIKLKYNLDKVIGEQNTLAGMQADFETLKPDIDDICFAADIFAGI